MNIRLAQEQELDNLMQLYAHAQNFMRQNGNPNQWGTEYPSREIIQEDIRKQQLWVCHDKEQILAAFVFAPGPDEAYATIYEGEWQNDEAAYWVIHRVASYGKTKGVATFCLDWCWQQQKNLRIDTHRDNLPMQNLLKKCGFAYCGVIYDIRANSERLAFQKSA